MRTEPVEAWPRGNPFKGRNIMTPDVTEFRKGTYEGRIVYIEIARGTGMSNQPIFGVTIREADGTELRPDPSKLCQSMSEVREYLESL